MFHSFHFIPVPLAGPLAVQQDGNRAVRQNDLPALEFAAALEQHPLELPTGSHGPGLILSYW